MKAKLIKETELFDRVLFFLLEKHKQYMEEQKETLSKMTNDSVDNGALVRGFVEYFHENPDELAKVIPYVQKSMSHQILKDVHQAMEKGADEKRLKKDIGVSDKVAELIVLRIK